MSYNSIQAQTTIIIFSSMVNFPTVGTFREITGMLSPSDYLIGHNLKWFILQGVLYSSAICKESLKTVVEICLIVLNAKPQNSCLHMFALTFYWRWTLQRALRAMWSFFWGHVSHKCHRIEVYSLESKLFVGVLHFTLITICGYFVSNEVQNICKTDFSKLSHLWGKIKSVLNLSANSKLRECFTV